MFRTTGHYCAQMDLHPTHPVQLLDLASFEKYILNFGPPGKPP